ncbi:MAG: hypothetical protein COB77_00025 [Gammaproteobacteria bacterium]|nr:MAG: hypothetical protein COB77_00025 [Gammaproteobacteria bacterium]
MKEQQDKQNDVALKIAIDAGVLIRCKKHEEIVFNGGEETQEAYLLGNERFSKGELGDVFTYRRDMTDAIKDTVATHQASTCSSCAK